MGVDECLVNISAEGKGKKDCSLRGGGESPPPLILQAEEGPQVEFSPILLSLGLKGEKGS